jgi:hypothetical protein
MTDEQYKCQMNKLTPCFYCGGHKEVQQWSQGNGFIVVECPVCKGKGFLREKEKKE